MLPCLIFEDDHLLVVNKPAGLNTHAPSPYAGEGIYDWLRHREPRWASLAIVHRLDKDTSGIIVFAKTPIANCSLTAQFTERTVQKKYLLLTDRQVSQQTFEVQSTLVRVGERYLSRPAHSGGSEATTRFKVLSDPPMVAGFRGLNQVEASPLTGRTHQIRVHAADKGFPILGDTLYGGAAAPRLYLHAAELIVRHPTTGEETIFAATADFTADSRARLRTALIDPEATTSYRLINGAADGWPGWYVERLGEYLLSQSATELEPVEQEELKRLAEKHTERGAYHKILNRQVRRASRKEASSERILGEAGPQRFAIRENGVVFELGMEEGYSFGLFLDQRDNRRRLLTGHIAAEFSIQPKKSQVLNTFAYTCGFSVCAAKAGAHTTSLDLSKKYLEWGKRNFALNQLDPNAHDFIYGDVFDWLRRLKKKKSCYDIVLLDPPTFSQSKEYGVFRVEKNYGELVTSALSLLKPCGVLFASTNASNWPPEAFLAVVEESIRTAGRKIVQRHYVPQPPDFPISREEPAYLKTIWLRVD